MEAAVSMVISEMLSLFLLHFQAVGLYLYSWKRIQKLKIDKHYPTFKTLPPEHFVFREFVAVWILLVCFSRANLRLQSGLSFDLLCFINTQEPKQVIAEGKSK